MSETISEVTPSRSSTLIRIRIGKGHDLAFEFERRVKRSSLALCRADLLTALVKKLCADTKKLTPDDISQGSSDASHQTTTWAQLAESFGEAEVKKATQGLKISQNSRAVMQVLARYSQYVRGREEVADDSDSEMMGAYYSDCEMAKQMGKRIAKLLMSSDYHKARDFYLWRGLYEYVYGQTVESAAEQAILDDTEFAAMLNHFFDYQVPYVDAYMMYI